MSILADGVAGQTVLPIQFSARAVNSDLGTNYISNIEILLFHRVLPRACRHGQVCQSTLSNRNIHQALILSPGFGLFRIKLHCSAITINFDRSSKLEVIFVLLPTSTMPGHQPLDLLRQTLNEAIREKVAGFDWNRVCLLPSISLRIDVFLQQEEGASVGDASSVKSVMSVSLSDKSGIFERLL